MKLRNCDLREFMKRANGKKVVCFGAGLWAEKLSEYFPEYHVEEVFSYCVDNNPALWGHVKVINDTKLEICPPKKLYGEADDDIIILITIANATEVYEQLEAIPALADTPCYCVIPLWGEETDRVCAEASGPPAGWRMNERIVIPKTIHYIWFGDNPMPETCLNYIETWRRFCPDYEIVEWNSDNYDLQRHQYMYEAYKAGRFAFVGDYARLDIVYEHGGVYMDVDVELLRPLDELLYNDAYMGFQDTYNVNLGSGFGAIKNFPLIRKLRDAYDDIPCFLDDGSFNSEVSTFYQTETLKKLGLITNGAFQILQGAALYPARYLAGKNVATSRSIADKDTYSIHHYAWSWQTGAAIKKREETRILSAVARSKESNSTI